jgi:hypothetical protein
MRAIPDSHNYRKHEEAARELERRFGHDRIQGAHHERDGPDGTTTQRPDRTPSRSELRQEDRTGITAKEVKRDVTAIFRSSPDANSFREGLSEKGYAIARGDRRDYVLVDQAGGIHSLARRIDGVKAAELRQFMAPLDRASIPSITDAREAQARLFGNADGHEVDLAKAYRRGEGYVSQSQAALKEHKQRQQQRDAEHRDSRERDDPLEALQKRERERASGEEDVHSESNSDDIGPSGNQELSEAMQGRLDRLRAAKAEYGTRPAKRGSGWRPHPGPLGGKGQALRGTFRLASTRCTQRYAALMTSSFKTAGPEFAQQAGRAMRATANLLLTARRLFRPQPSARTRRPHRPSKRGGMSEAQRVDLQAAMDGKITWAQYFSMWGPG